MTKTVVIFLAFVTLGMPLIGSAREWRPLEDYSSSRVTSSNGCSIKFSVGRYTFYRNRRFIDQVISKLVSKGFTPYLWDFYINRRNELVRLPYNPRPLPDMTESFSLWLEGPYEGGRAVRLLQVAKDEKYTTYQTIAYNEIGPDSFLSGRQKLLQMIQLLPSCIDSSL